MISQVSAADCKAQLIQDVVRVFHKLCPLFDEGMTTSGQWRMYGARNSEHFPALLQCLPGGNEGAAFQGCFHYQTPPAHPADDAVAARKIASQRGRSKGKLRHKQASFGQLMRKLPVRCWIDDIQTSPHDPDARPGASQSSAMSGCIDPARHSTNDA